MGWQLTYPFAVAIFAFVGAVVTLCTVYLLSRHSAGTHTLVLTGLALGTFLLAVEGALLYMFRDRYSLIQLWMEWSAGSFIDRSWVHVHQQLPLTIIGITGSLRYRKELNLLSLGDEEALNLGVDVNRIRWRLFLFVALLTAGSLAGCGIIPFFGLVLPHLIRLYSGADHRILLPACCFFGASLLLFMELTLRQFSVHALTIGQLSAFFGGLFYLTMVVRRDAFRRSA
jgi:iron complex transport system permease protein